MSKVLPPILETGRLILRPLKIEDLQDPFKWTGLKQRHIMRIFNI
jgi:hypothetical protein